MLARIDSKTNKAIVTLTVSESKILEKARDILNVLTAHAKESSTESASGITSLEEIIRRHAPPAKVKLGEPPVSMAKYVDPNNENEVNNATIDRSDIAMKE